MQKQLCFQKKHVFLKLIIFFILRNNHIPAKVNKSCKRNLKKGNDALNSFLGLADVSSYLTFKFSVWREGYTTSFELKILQTSLTPFWKAVTKF